MSEEKRYYWIKLKDAFLTSDTVDFLMGQKNGANYVVLYQMLCLKTANTNGVLGRQLGELLVPYDAAKITRDCKYFDFDTVVVALGLYQKLGLVYVQEDGMLKIAHFDSLIGSEGEDAERKRVSRAKAKELPAPVEQSPNKARTMSGQCPNNVRTGARKEKVTQKEKEPELEKEQEIEKDIEPDTDKEKEKEKDKANTVCLTDCLKSLPEKPLFFYNWLLEHLDRSQPYSEAFRTFIGEVASRETSTINNRPTPREVILRAYQYFVRPDGSEVLGEVLGQVECKWRSGEIKNRYAYTVSTLYNTASNAGYDGWDATED